MSGAGLLVHTGEIFVIVFLLLEQTPAMFVMMRFFFSFAFGNIELGFFFLFSFLFCGNDKRGGRIFQGQHERRIFYIREFLL